MSGGGVSITVMTLNLQEGDQGAESPNSWEKRRDICVSVITSYSPTFLCTQQGYEQSGISRKGSQDTSDEHCTIFYDKEKVELREGGTFWLSESPSVPGSISWGSTVPCIATWAISIKILIFVNYCRLVPIYDAEEIWLP